MPTVDKRIIELNTEATSITSDQYIMTDSQDNGTRKFRLSRITDITGSLASLDTEAKGSIVAAVNEVKGEAGTNATAIGDLTDLDTTVQTDLVSAINEVAGVASDNESKIGTLSSLDTTTKTNLVEALNEVLEFAKDENVRQKLLADCIPGTTQAYLFLDGKVTQIIHSSSGSTVRTDTFTYGIDTITETRTLSTGQVLSIATNLQSLATTVTFSTN